MYRSTAVPVCIERYGPYRSNRTITKPNEIATRRESRSQREPSRERTREDLASTRMRVDFSRWEDGDPTGWILRAKWYFRYHRTLEASMVDIATIHQGREAIQ
ncbi:hypothetical protein BHM03_00014689 [Ensete ventricosum]|nr:hypothetical protein BHM03_00014689 [Ensete ventricosum]